MRADLAKYIAVCEDGLGKVGDLGRCCRTTTLTVPLAALPASAS